MSQSGITSSEDLQKTFNDAISSGTIRSIKVSIVNESLIPDGTSSISGTWEEDFQAVVEYLTPTNPAYVLYRLDSRDKSSNEYEWALFSYVPDHSKVREKMLYASTRLTLLRELGEGRFTDRVFGTSMDDFTLEGYKKHITHQNAAAPLTERERELADLKLAEKSTDNIQGTQIRHSVAPGLAFPMTEDAVDALKSFGSSDRYNYVELMIDSVKETIELVNAAAIEADEIGSSLPSNEPRFTFFKYKHDISGNEALSTIFIYTCPGNSKIKERMLYSSSRSSIIGVAETEYGITFVKKVETSDPKDINAKFLFEELYPNGPPDSNTGENMKRTEMLGAARPGGFKRPAPPGKRKI